MTRLKEWWRWFKRQSWLNKVIIVGLSSSFVLFLIPLTVSWLRPTPIHVGVAFYIYERAFILEGDSKTYFYEKRSPANRTDSAKRPRQDPCSAVLGVE